MRNTQHEHRASNCASINPLCSRALVILSSKRSAVMSLGVSSQMFNGALSFPISCLVSWSFCESHKAQANWISVSTNKSKAANTIIMYRYQPWLLLILCGVLKCSAALNPLSSNSMVCFFCFVSFSKSCYSMQLQQLKVYPILKIFQKCPYKPWDCSSRKCISVPIKKRYSTCFCF